MYINMHALFIIIIQFVAKHRTTLMFITVIAMMLTFDSSAKPQNGEQILWYLNGIVWITILNCRLSAVSLSARK